MRMCPSSCAAANRTVPVGAPMGEYVLWFNLYDEGTGRLLATTHVHIFVGWDHL